MRITYLFINMLIYMILDSRFSNTCNAIHVIGITIFSQIQRHQLFFYMYIEEKILTLVMVYLLNSVKYFFNIIKLSRHDT